VATAYDYNMVTTSCSVGRFPVVSYVDAIWGRGLLMPGLRWMVRIGMALTFFFCADHSYSDGVVVTGKVFTGPGKDGDFSWMIEQSQYRDVLFIFNDNEQQLRAHQDTPESAERLFARWWKCGYSAVPVLNPTPCGRYPNGPKLRQSNACC
jgi:hypothetical protein